MRGARGTTKRGTSKGAVRVIIRNVHLINNYVLPFFKNLGFISKKGLDFSDFVLICHLLYIGAHRDENIKSLILKLSDTMNNSRLSNSKKAVTIMTKDEMGLLMNATPHYEHLADGRIIEIRSQRVVNQCSIYVINSPDGLVQRALTIDEIVACVGSSRSRINSLFQSNPEGGTINGYFVKRVKVFGPQ